MHNIIWAFARVHALTCEGGLPARCDKKVKIDKNI